MAPTSSSATASAGRVGTRRRPGSPWMPTPSSISLSPRVKVGFPAAGTVQLVSATPIEPHALALSPDGRTLYVAMAGSNAVAVVRLGAKVMRVAGLLPAGWYPTAVATSADGRALYVANGKGNG